MLLQLGLKFIQIPNRKYFSNALDGLLQDIEATFDKYIWPKSRSFTKVQNNIMANVLSDIKQMIHSVEVRPPKLNLPMRLRRALISLKEDPSIIIAKADKGDAVVILDSEHYYGLANKHLADQNIYELLETDPSEEIILRYHRYLKRCVTDGVLDDYQYSRLRAPSDYRLPSIYFLPKIHKNPLKLRPIVASIKGITSNASRFINIILQPYMKQVDSYVKNATHIINILKTTRVPHTSYLASLDIESLYTNISFDMAIEVLLKIFAKHPRLVLILDLVKFVLKNNIFQFNGKIYHQICGIAMGTTMAPALASIVVAYYEEQFLTKYELKPLLWRRYIDDVLTIWPYSKQDFKLFFEGLNSIHPNLKFTMEISYISIQFLDLIITKDLRFLRTGQLATCIYFKHTNTFSYLHGCSFIATHVFKGIAIGELVRTLRNTSNPGCFKWIKRILIKRFYQRGFPLRAIQAAKKIQFRMRDRYLETLKHKKLLRPIPVSTKFCHYTPSVGLIFRTAWARVSDEPVLSQLFPTAPFPVWLNHQNVKNIMSYKHKNFDASQRNWVYCSYNFLKFNRPKARKRSNTI